MRAHPSLLVSLIRTARGLASTAIPGVAIAVGPTAMADTVAERIASAASGLAESTPSSTPPLVLARARGHLDALTGQADAAALAAEEMGDIGMIDIAAMGAGDEGLDTIGL